jgi:predicted MPP superfamily phosphohydrolase
VRGTGVGQVPIRFIAEPEIFKHEVGQQLYA